VSAIGASGETMVAVVVAGTPRTVTLPPSMARRAWARDATRPLRTSSASRRAGLPNVAFELGLQPFEEMFEDLEPRLVVTLACNLELSVCPRAHLAGLRCLCHACQ
jgi:hypothetical protein